MVLHVDGFALHKDAADTEFRVRDVDLAEHLGYDQPRDIRKLIHRMVETGELSGVLKRATVARMKNKHGDRAVEVDEYWLDQIEALLVVMRSEAPNAIPMRRVIASVFYKALRSYEDSRSALRSLPAHIERWFLSTTAIDFQSLWPDSLIREIERLHGRQWAGGRHPFHLKSTYPGIYRMVMGSSIADKMFANNPDRERLRHHQFLTPEARPFVVAQLGIVESIARGADNKADFWSRMEREFAGGMLQLSIVPPS